MSAAKPETVFVCTFADPSHAPNPVKVENAGDLKLALEPLL